MRYFSNEEFWDHHVNEEINNYKREAVESLKTIVDPRFVDKVLPLISYCFQEEFPEAQSVFSKLNLGEMHAVAAMDNRDQFRILLREDEMEREASYQFEALEYEGTYA